MTSRPNFNTTIGALTDAGTLSLSDQDIVERAGTAYKTTMTQRTALFRKTPAGSRTATLPVVLTSADHDKNIVLSGTTGNLSVDGTVADGFRCHVVNQASGVATYSGITGLLATTSLASGGVTTIMMAGATVYASAAGGAAPANATSFTTSPTSISGNTGVAQNLTFAPNGAWVSGQTVNLTPVTVAGTFAAVSGCTVSGTTVTPNAGSTVNAVVAFTPSSANGTTGSLTVGGTSITATNTSVAVSVTAAAATAYTAAFNPTGPAAPNVATALVLTPNGTWPTSGAISVTFSGGAVTVGALTGGSLSGTGPYTLTPTAGTAAMSLALTPTAASTTITATMTNTFASPTIGSNPAAATYTVGAVAGPSLPPITSGATRLAAFIANLGVTPANASAGTTVTALADQLGGASLTGTTGAQVGANVNSKPGILISTPGVGGSLGSTTATWLQNVRGAVTLPLVFRTGATVGNGTLLDHETSTASDGVAFYVNANNLYCQRKVTGGTNFAVSVATLAANTTYKIIFRFNVNASTFDLWINGVKTSPAITAQAAITGTISAMRLGQNATSGQGDFGANGYEILEYHPIQGALTDAEITTASTGYIDYLTSQWGS